MLEELKEDVFISQELRYYNLNNIFFDAPLLDNQIEELKQIFFSINNINQIYFRSNVDLKTIEIIKYLLEISPTMDDSKVEKYLIDTNINFKELSDIVFINPSTWYVNDELDKKKLVSIDRYRQLYNEVNKVLNNIDVSKYSNIEKIGLIYDFCKKIKLSNNVDYDFLDILKTKKSNILGLAKIFKLLLKKIGIKSFIGEVINDDEISNVLIIEVKDNKYDIDGIYLFDVVSDYIFVEDVPNESYRLLNYNYFAIPIKDYSKTVFSDKLGGILNCLVHDLEYDLEKIRYISKLDIEQLENSFENDFYEIHNKVLETKEIKDSVKLDIICSINDENLSKILKENYSNRQNKLLNYEI